MRARYSAYVAGDDAFIAASWHATTRVPMTSLNHEPGAQAPTQWLGLDIRRHEAAGDTATVEFVARFKTGGRAERLHEISRFVREGGAWWYVDGSFPDAQAGSTTGSKTATMTKARTQKQ